MLTAAVGALKKKYGVGDIVVLKDRRFYWRQSFNRF
jgi:purine nucleoside phosphorylase